MKATDETGSSSSDSSSEEESTKEQAVKPAPKIQLGKNQSSSSEESSSQEERVLPRNKPTHLEICSHFLKISPYNLQKFINILTQCPVRHQANNEKSSDDSSSSKEDSKIVAKAVSTKLASKLSPAKLLTKVDLKTEESSSAEDAPKPPVKILPVKAAAQQKKSSSSEDEPFRKTVTPKVAEPAIKVKNAESAESSSEESDTEDEPTVKKPAVKLSKSAKKESSSSEDSGGELGGEEEIQVKKVKTEIKVKLNSPLITSKSRSTCVTKSTLKDKSQAKKIKEIMEQALQDHLNGKKFDSDEASKWTIEIANIIRQHVTDLNLHRYKHIVQVVIGELNGAGVKSGLQCLWDPETDSYTSAIFRNETIFASALVFSIYFY